MKLKRALFSFIVATAIIVPTLSGISACSFIRNNWERPTVTFNGDPIMVPNGGVKEFNLEGFTFSRPLYPDEHVSVIVIDEENEPSASVTATPTYMANNDKMNVKFDVTPAEIHTDQKFEFKLQFEFSYGTKKQIYDGLDKVFTYQYTGEWLENSVTGELSTYGANYNPDTNRIEFSVGSLTLGRNLEFGERLEVEVLNGGKVKYLDKTITPNQNDTAQLTIKFILEEQNRLNDYNGSFKLKFNFYDTKNILQKEQTLESQGTVKYRRERDRVEVKLYNENNTAFFAQNGSNTCNFPDNTLVFTRPLSPAEGGYNEKLDLSITDEQGDPIEGLDFTYNYNTTEIFDVAITYDNSSAQYEEKTYNLKIHWEIAEQTPSSTSFDPDTGDIAITFTYIPIWAEKNASYFGQGAGGADPIEFNNDSEGGTRSIDIDSFSEQESSIVKADYGFIIDKRLSPNETVSVSLTNEDETNPLELESSTPTLTDYVDEQGNEQVLVGIKIRYKASWFNDNPSRVTTNYSAPFKLNFTFAITGTDFDITQTLDEEFKLIYNKPESSDHLAVSLGEKYDLGEHGDTIIQVSDGSLNRAFSTTDDEFVSVITDVEGITVMEGAQGSGYENKVKFDGSNLSMFVEIDPSIITRFDADQKWDVTFTFTFKYQGTEYTKTATTEIWYIGFSNEITDYINARIVPIGIYYQDSYGWHPFFLTAWILGDATPENESDYNFYIATSANAAEVYEEQTDPDYVRTFRIGITDKKFSAQYSYNDSSRGGTWSNPINAYFYRKNYIYFKNNAIQWLDKDFKWNDGSGCNIRVGKINFNESFETFDSGDLNNQEWIATYLNKLIKLNNYNHLYGHINGIVDEPITNIEENYQRYQKFGVSGYEAVQHTRWRDSSRVETNPSNATMTVWKDFTFTTQYVETAEQWSPALTYISPSDLKAKNLTFKSTSGDDLIDGSPAYSANTKWSCGILNVQEYYGIESLTGGMIAVVDNSAAENEDKVRLLGFYWGTDHSLNGSDFYPYFDMFYDGTTNLLEDYL